MSMIDDAEKRGLIKYAVKASVGGQVACEATLLCTQRKLVPG